MENLERLRGEIELSSISRSDILKHAMALGLSALTIAGLLAACGDGESAAETDDTSVSGKTPTKSEAEETSTQAEANEIQPS